MKKFQTMGELIAYMVGANAPSELKTEAENQMQAVEEVNQGGATAFLIIAETKAEAKQVEKEYSLSNCVSESSRLINTLDGAYWNERVYVFGDDGGGVIYYERVPLLP
jgi:hypothetical protein